MFPFVSEAFAMGAPPQGGGDTTSAMIQFIPLVLIFAIFWFLVIRPQSKKAKQHRDMISALQKGDEVFTDSGIRGTIVNRVDAGQTEITLEIAPKVQIRVLRSRIGEMVAKQQEPTKSVDTVKPS